MDEKGREEERNKYHIFRECRKGVSICVFTSILDIKILEEKFNFFFKLRKTREKSFFKTRKVKLRSRAIILLSRILIIIFNQRKKNNFEIFFFKLKKTFFEEKKKERIEILEKRRQDIIKSKIFLELFLNKEAYKTRREDIKIALKEISSIFKLKNLHYFEFFFQNFKRKFKEETPKKSVESKNRVFVYPNIIKNNVKNLSSKPIDLNPQSSPIKKKGNPNK